MALVDIHNFAPVDGSYSEHGHEIFDEEADPQVGGQGTSGKKRPRDKMPVKRRVAKPGGIKAMVMGMGGVAKKRKEVGVYFYHVMIE